MQALKTSDCVRDRCDAAVGQLLVWRVGIYSHASWRCAAKVAASRRGIPVSTDETFMQKTQTTGR